MIGDDDWKKNAACRSLGAGHWFPDYSSNRELQTARQVCGACPVNNECLEWALRYEDYGVWGGLTPQERETLQRKLRRGTAKLPYYVA